MSHWTLFSNHGHVLLFVSHQPEARLRDIADRVGITERAVQKIVRDLQDGGLVSVVKHGRCNRYQVHGNSPLRHDLEAHCSVSELVALIHPDDAAGEAHASVSATSTIHAAGTDQPDAAGPSRSEATIEAAAAPARAADPEPEPAPMPEPPPPPASAPAPETTPETPTEPPTAATGKRRRKRADPDDGEQGSLF